MGISPRLFFAEKKPENQPGTDVPGSPVVLVLLPLAVWMWLAMMLTHEFGHVLAAWATGGTLVSVNLYPGQLSSTLVQPSPRPSVVLWSGVLSGWLVPTALAGAARQSPPPIRAASACWAAFCLLAGGLYLAIGGGQRLTDTGQLKAAGWPLGLLVAVGAAVAIAGYLWSRRAWPRLFAELQARPPTARIVVAAWLLLGGWIAGQWLLADALSKCL